MTKISLAKKIYAANADKDRQEIINLIMEQLKVKKGNAAIYFAKCAAQAEVEGTRSDRIEAKKEDKQKPASKPEKRIADPNKPLLHNIKNFKDIPFSEDDIPAFLKK